MLTILHREILAAIREFPGGLLAARAENTGKLLLIIKTPKEYILAARIRKGFSFYLAPLPSSSGLTVALVTAFFDDSDEPLVIRTPIFNELLGHNILELLSYDELDVYFFDEHGREWMSYRSSLIDRGSILVTDQGFGLLDYHPKTVPSLYHTLDNWFGCRTATDDDHAIKVTFLEELSPSDMMIFDAQDENHDYIGSGGYSFSLLERTNPGYFQERDIVSCLKRAFRGDQLALNPRRRDNNNEFVDILATAPTHLLLVQAKDSPNTEASLSRTIDRKRRTSHSQIDKGIKQAKGAAAYPRGRDILELHVGNEQFDIDLVDRSIINLVVVQEMFADEGDLFFDRYREMKEFSDVFVILDYSAFNSFCHEFPDEQTLIRALSDYSLKIYAKGSWIDPRPYVLDFIQERLNRKSS